MSDALWGKLKLTHTEGWSHGSSNSTCQAAYTMAYSDFDVLTCPKKGSLADSRIPHLVGWWVDSITYDPIGPAFLSVNVTFTNTDSRTSTNDREKSKLTWEQLRSRYTVRPGSLPFTFKSDYYDVKRLNPNIIAELNADLESQGLPGWRSTIIEDGMLQSPGMWAGSTPTTGPFSERAAPSLMLTSRALPTYEFTYYKQDDPGAFVGGNFETNPPSGFKINGKELTFTAGVWRAVSQKTKAMTAYDGEEYLEVRRVIQGLVNIVDINGEQLLWDSVRQGPDWGSWNWPE